MPPVRHSKFYHSPALCYPVSFFKFSVFIWVLALMSCPQELKISVFSTVSKMKSSSISLIHSGFIKGGIAPTLIFVDLLPIQMEKVHCSDSIVGVESANAVSSSLKINYKVSNSLLLAQNSTTSIRFWNGCLISSRSGFNSFPVLLRLQRNTTVLSFFSLPPLSVAVF